MEWSRRHKLMCKIENAWIIEDDFTGENKVLNMHVLYKLSSYVKFEDIDDFILSVVSRCLNKAVRSIYFELFGDKIKNNNVNIFDDYCAFKKIL